MARFCGRTRGGRGKGDGDGDFPRSTLAFCVDALCISAGSLLGCSPVTAFIESGAGIAVGGRTGLTAVVAGLCFLASLFFSPILASIPPWATGSTLILVSFIGGGLGMDVDFVADFDRLDRVHDGQTGHTHQLGVYWRRRAVYGHACLHPLQLQRGIWAYCVSSHCPVTSPWMS